MKYVILLFATSMLFLSGCWADKFFGLREDPVTGEVTKEDGSPVERIGAMADKFIPGAEGVAAGLAALWFAIRGRKWKAAFVSTAQVLENAAEIDTTGAIKTLKATLSTAHDVAGVQSIIAPVIDKLNR
jgi:hypothetical protein